MLLQHLYLVPFPRYYCVTASDLEKSSTFAIIQVPWKHGRGNHECSSAFQHVGSKGAPPPVSVPVTASAAGAVPDASLRKSLIGLRIKIGKYDVAECCAGQRSVTQTAAEV